MKNNLGFTLIELIVVMSITLTLLAVTSILLLGPQESSELEGAYQSILADLNQQRSRAMLLDTGGDDAIAAYGVYFQNQSYVLFRGLAYVADDINNHTITLSNSVNLIDVSWPNSTIVFAAGSGEVISFSSGTNTLSVASVTAPDSRVITLNRYGSTQ